MNREDFTQKFCPGQNQSQSRYGMTTRLAVHSIFLQGQFFRWEQKEDVKGNEDIKTEVATSKLKRNRELTKFKS